jgi:hypothetical protein
LVYRMSAASRSEANRPVSRRVPPVGRPVIPQPSLGGVPG